MTRSTFPRRFGCELRLDRQREDDERAFLMQKSLSRRPKMLISNLLRGAGKSVAQVWLRPVPLLLCVVICFANCAQAQSNLYTDKYGYTTGTIGNRGVNIYSDRYGNTTGTIGNQRIDTYSGRSGNTTGVIGNRRIDTYSDRYGNTTGTIGNNGVNLYTDRSGNTTGTIGGRHVTCHTDPIGNTICN